VINSHHTRRCGRHHARSRNPARTAARQSGCPGFVSGDIQCRPYDDEERPSGGQCRRPQPWIRAEPLADHQAEERQDADRQNEGKPWGPGRHGRDTQREKGAGETGHTGLGRVGQRIEPGRPAEPGSGKGTSLEQVQLAAARIRLARGST
jgi:hypothetical protein